MLDVMAQSYQFVLGSNRSRLVIKVDCILELGWHYIKCLRILLREYLQLIMPFEIVTIR
ncbi:MAG: hypothetical protein ACRDZX_02120 [Acidimicrobiales bacterium]